jgi:hypothetical protein
MGDNNCASEQMEQMPFPNQVQVQPAPAVEGDYASTNPRFTVLAGPGGLIAGTGAAGGVGGITVGRWCWLSDQYIDADNAPAVANQFGSGSPTGLLHREQQGLIEVYLQEYSMVLPSGFPCTLTNGGDMWVKNRGSSVATVGMYAFANFADGSTQFGAGGTVGVSFLAGFTATGSIGPQSVTCLGSINGNVLTVYGTASGFIPIGATVTGGTGITATTVIVAQLSGVTGSAGGATYAVNIPQQSVNVALLTFAYGLLTVTGTPSGTLGVGDFVTGTTTPLTASTFISALGTGTGGAGTYYVNNSQTAGSQTLTSQTNVQTKWFAASQGKAGELVKISSHVLG